MIKGNFLEISQKKPHFEENIYVIVTNFGDFKHILGFFSFEITIFS
jgi:hypothetical protein